MPAATKRMLQLHVPGAPAVTIDAQVMFQGDGTVGFSITLNEAVKAKLEAAVGAGKTLLKQLPAIGLGVSAALAVPRVAAAAEEDKHYAAMMREMGAEPKLEGLSTLRELAIIGGEETGGELGGWGGAAAGAAVSWETGPGVIIGTVAGALIFGFAGDSVGGWAAEYFFDKAAEDLYEQRVLGAQVNE